MTHTYAILDVSSATYAEIRKLLTDAGYEHAFHDELIDMHGIAVRAGRATAPESVHPSHLSTVIEVLEGELEALRARLLGAEAANAAIPLVEHSELSGHIDLAEQCRDWIVHESQLSEHSNNSKLQDFSESLRIVIDQLDRQRRQRNWYEVAYTAGKQKLIESAVNKALNAARAAARAYAAHVEELGGAVDDNDPAVMATAEPIGAAQADLYMALGIYEEELAMLKVGAK